MEVNIINSSKLTLSRKVFPLFLCDKEIKKLKKQNYRIHIKFSILGTNIAFTLLEAALGKGSAFS
jgi:hypothetical protein